MRVLCAPELGSFLFEYGDEVDVESIVNVSFLIDWPMGTQPRALYLACSPK